MQSRVRGFPARVQPLHATPAVQVHAHAPAQVVRRRGHRDAVFGQVDAPRFEFGGDARKVRQRLPRVDVGHVQKNARRRARNERRALNLHVDRASDDVPRRELAPLVVPRHEPLARVVEQAPAVPANSLGDEKRVLVRRLLRRAAGPGVQTRRVELVKLHVRHVRGRANRHRDAVPGAHARVGRAREELPGAPGGEQHAVRVKVNLRAVDATRDRRPDAHPAGRLPRTFLLPPLPLPLLPHPGGLRVLRHLRTILLRPLDDDQVPRDVVLVEGDVGMRLSRLQERALDLLPGHVGGVHDALLAVPALAREVELARVFAPRELRAELDESVDRVLALRAHDVHRSRVAQKVPRDVRVPRVIGGGVVGAHHRGDAALGVVRGALVGDVLRDDRDAAVLGGLQGVGQAADAAADDEVIHDDFLARDRGARLGARRRRARGGGGGRPRELVAARALALDRGSLNRAAGARDRARAPGRVRDAVRQPTRRRLTLGMRIFRGARVPPGSGRRAAGGAASGGSPGGATRGVRRHRAAHERRLGGARGMNPRGGGPESARGTRVASRTAPPRAARIRGDVTNAQSPG